MLSADEDAQFWVFYRKTSEALFRKAYRMCRGQQADADDAHQRTYLKALEHWPTVSSLADQQRNAWLATTLAREVLQIWRAPYRSELMVPMLSSREIATAKLAIASPGWRGGSATLSPCIALPDMRSPK